LEISGAGEKIPGLLDRNRNTLFGLKRVSGHAA